MAIKLYWHRGPGKNDENRQNFGDYLSPLIVEAVSGKKVVYAPPSSADMMAIGTILANERKAKFLGFRRKLHIWGSGCGRPEELVSSRHYYHAVRGMETKKRIDGAVGDIPFGDPGLLSDILIKPNLSKKFSIGFVPHYVDKEHADARRFCEVPSVHLIDVYRPPVDVLMDISACDFVVSSSLHGLVVADAFSIPNVRAVFSSGLIDELKFDDYYSAFEIGQPRSLCGTELSGITKMLPDLADNYRRPRLQEIKDCLIKNFPGIC